MLGALIVPPLVTEATTSPTTRRSTRSDVTHYVEKNKTLRKLNNDYDITDKLQKEAGKLPNKLGGAARHATRRGLRDRQLVFALVTILILTRVPARQRRRWVDAIAAAPAARAREGACAARSRTWRSAVGGYVAGVLLQATIAGPQRHTSC